MYFIAVLSTVITVVHLKAQFNDFPRLPLISELDQEHFAVMLYTKLDLGYYITNDRAGCSGRFADAAEAGRRKSD
jgi:hypothetical protein